MRREKIGKKLYTSDSSKTRDITISINAFEREEEREKEALGIKKTQIQY